METTANKLNNIIDSKESIKSALNEKNGYTDDILSSYSYKIMDIYTPNYISLSDTITGSVLGGDFYNQYISNISQLNAVIKGHISYTTPDGIIINSSTLKKFDVYDTTNLYNLVIKNNFLKSFSISNSKSIKSVIIDDSSPYGYITSLYGAFANCTTLKRLSLINLTQLSNMSNMLSSCSNLTSIYIYNSMNLINGVGKPDFIKGLFNDCTNLENFYINNFGGNQHYDEEPLKYWGIDKCTKLTRISLRNICNALPKLVSWIGQEYCKIGSTNLAKLSEDDKKIATDKGWVLI